MNSEKFAYQENSRKMNSAYQDNSRQVRNVKLHDWNAWVEERNTELEEQRTELEAKCRALRRQRRGSH